MLYNVEIGFMMLQLHEGVGWKMRVLFMWEEIENETRGGGGGGGGC